MSDRHAAEKLFSQLLSDYREDILPDGWDEMSRSQKSQLIRMNNFFCGLHYLVGLADSAEATLKLCESTIDEDACQGNSSGTQRLIRTACKAFHSNKLDVQSIFVHIFIVKVYTKSLWQHSRETTVS